MNLRRQLLLVSLLTLVLPWAGCQFVKETETALRNGQRQLLNGTAQAIADSFAQFPDELLAEGAATVNGDQIYGHPLSQAPSIDGYFDDWPLDRRSMRSMRGADGDIDYIVSVNRQHVFLYVEVRDNAIVYANANAPASQVDHISLVTTGDSSQSVRIVFSTEAPGAVTATRTIGTQSIVENRIAARWQDTPTGYQLEARIPRSFISSRIGIEVNNVSAGKAITSRSYQRNLPGFLITSSSLLTSVADGYANDGLRLMVTNISGWRVALAGDLNPAIRDNEYSLVPRGWQLLAYRLLLERGDSPLLAEPSASGRENQDYVARALNGESSTKWFRNEDTGRAVVAVAQPIWSGSVQTGALILQQDTDAILSLTNESLMRLIALTMLATVGAAAALLGYASWLSLRIRKLSHAADHALDDVASPMELPSSGAADEIGDLSRTFSSVLQQLASYNEYLRSLASKLSHEMRTPLTIVTSSLENLDHEPLSDQSREYTERARSGAKRLQKILSAMSEANRVEQLMEHVEAERFDINRVLSSATDAYQATWTERAFSFAGVNAGIHILGSPELVVQMLDKLIDNAIDFSAEGDEISITLTTDEKDAVVCVSNPGPPLPDKMRHRLFESMVSVRDKDDQDNLGLGLNISKLIAEGHGGSITADNTNDGVKFEIRIPISNPQN